MTGDLNPTLALAKQALDELQRLVPMDAIARGEFGDGGQRTRVVNLLAKLNTAISVVKRYLSDVVVESTAAPILTLPAVHRSFWSDVLEPQGKALQQAYLVAIGLDEFSDLLDEPAPDDRPRHLMLSAISWGIERWSDSLLDEDERLEWRERGFDIEGAIGLVSMPWFQPDEWSRNFSLLEPVLVDRPASVMRDHVRYRLLEIYRAFAFGLWMSAIALARSLVEFSLRSTAPRFQISITREGPGERIEEKSLKQLGEEVSAHFPTAVASSIEVVRETGNRILHPKKHDVISHPKVMRAEALECIRAARKVVQALYSDLPTAANLPLGPRS